MPSSSTHAAAGLTAAQQADLELLVPPRGVKPLEERKVGRYTVRNLRRDEIPRAIQLFRDVMEYEYRFESWDWRHYQRNPGLVHMPAAFTDEGALAGVYPCTLRPARVLGRDLITCQACRTLTHPAHRGGGRVFALMSRFTVDRCWSIGAHFGYGGGANEAALKVGRKLIGYTLMYELEHRQQRLSLRLALERRLGRPVGGLLAGVVDRLQSRRLRTEVGGVEVEEVRAIGPEFDELWERYRDRYDVLIRRDAREVEWRWILCPTESHVLAAYKEGRLEGYAAVRHYTEREDGTRASILLDMFAGRQEDVVAALMAAAAGLSQAAGSAFLYFAPAPGSIAHALAREEPWAEARKANDYVIVRDLCHDREAVGLKTEIDAACVGSNWHYCQGDSDFWD